MAFVKEAIISGFISKIINDGIDITKEKIRKADKDRKSQNRNFETRIYQIMIDAVNRVTYNQYAGKDALYDAAEKILIGFKNEKRNRMEIVKDSLSALIRNIDDAVCESFIEILFCEISSKKCNDELYKEILLLLLKEEALFNHEEFQQIKELLKEMNVKLDESHEFYKKDEPWQGTRNRTKEYADKWNENMFLNDYNIHDEEHGVNVRLCDVYLDEHLPYYIWGHNTEASGDLKILLSEYIERKAQNKMLLILGQPGIGKSTLITWITAKYADRLDDILIYRFASDLNAMNRINLKDNMIDGILEALNLTYGTLYNKILILDGLDEIDLGNYGLEIVNQLYWKLIKNSSWYKVSIIITCREHYIHEIRKVKCDYITLQPWNERQIRSFCSIYKTKTDISIFEDTIENAIENREILGIPLILYMVLALNITIEKEGSIVDVYDKIFSLEGGIYDRCIEDKMFEKEHRIGRIKEQIHQISREIAIWMFENNPVEACIQQKEYEKIFEKVIQESKQENDEENDQKYEDIKQDILIGNYFKLIRHCEGVKTEKLYFVHRSIYEYFVAETIYTSIKNILIDLSKESQDILAKNLAVYLKQGRITNTMGKYLQVKILKLYNGLDRVKQEKFYRWWEETVEKMISNGMLYYTKVSIQTYKNILDKEIQCFSNLVKLLSLLFETNERKYMMENVNREQLEKYIRYRIAAFRMEDGRGRDIFDLSRAFLSKINLTDMDFRGVNLQDANLCKANLQGSNLQGVNLSGTDLSKTDLANANLQGANLQGAYLQETNMQKINLRGANLSKTDLTEKNLHGADLQGANLRETSLKGTNLSGTNLSETDLSGENLQKTDLQGANLHRAILIGTDLSEADLYSADLREGNLQEAILRKANLQNADLQKTNLQGADFTEAKIVEVNLQDANLRDAVFDEDQVYYLEKRYDLTHSKVYVFEKERMVMYPDYREERRRH